jgi:YD repeat-containing protein
LALTRTSNSRNAWGNAFGVPGAWRHSYQWSIQVSARGTSPQDIHYTIDFPDGRTETFNYSTADVDYRAAPGVRERLEPWTATNGTYGVCYLVLPDGGKVEFSGTRTFMYDPELIPPNWYEFDLVATAIIDPHGQRTTFSYDAYRRLNRVTEPAGRYLQFYYRTSTGPTIDHVTEVINGINRRTVQYGYTNSAFPPGTQVYTALTSVVYYGNWTARYTYRAPNVGNVNGLPLLSTADDPFYPGPMKRIAYTYKTGTNPDGTAAVTGKSSVKITTTGKRSARR